jgi:2-iminobutanoate/2-iminopropanoate deaminase
MRKVIQTEDAPQPQGPYSQAIVSEGFIFVAGQGPIKTSTNEFELGDIQSETRLTLTNIQSILQAAGGSLQDVVRVGVFLSDLRDFSGMNEVYREFFPQDQPARTTVGVQLPRIKVEIDCVAKVSKPKKKLKID